LLEISSLFKHSKHLIVTVLIVNKGPTQFTRISWN